MLSVVRLLARIPARYPSRRRVCRTRWLVPGLIVVAGALLCLFFWHPAPVPTLLSAATVEQSAPGQGAGGSGTPMQPHAPALCNPFDANCYADSLASWVAGKIQGVFQPIADQILQNPADIVYQTPPADSYQNQTIVRLNEVFVNAVDFALASLIAIGALTIMVAPYWRTLATSLSDFIPRAILVVGAVHFNLTFISWFIDLENTLCLTVIHFAGLTMLTNLLTGLFTGNPIQNLLVWLLVVVLGVMVIFLLFQMITRIALVAVCIATAPLGLCCLLLPQTMRWGRLWLTIFSSSVMVQFLQVVTLGLGGMFLAAIASTSLVRLDLQLANAFLAIGTMTLVLKIPGMIQNWALHPMMDGFGGGESSSSSGSGGATGSSASGGSGGGGGSGSAGAGSGSATWGDMGAGMGGSTMMEGTVVTEESGALLLLF
jgi:hypothetical protein